MRPSSNRFVSEFSIKQLAAVVVLMVLGAGLCVYGTTYDRQSKPSLDFALREGFIEGSPSGHTDTLLRKGASVYQTSCRGCHDASPVRIDIVDAMLQGMSIDTTRSGSAAVRIDAAINAVHGLPDNDGTEPRRAVSIPLSEEERRAVAYWIASDINEKAEEKRSR